MLITLTHIDTACILLNINGYRIMLDPTLDRAGHLYHHGYGSLSRKTSEPAIKPDQLPAVDLILLTHHQHKDNFDNEGRKFAARVPLVLSTTAAAKSVPGITGMENWECREIDTPLVPGLRITATPAQHHPWWIPEFISGKVIGFVIEIPTYLKEAIYITGDTVYFRGIEEVARRFAISTAIIHVGSVQFRYLTGFGQYTMDGRGLLKTARLLKPRRVVPIHYKGWTHFKETEASLRKIIAADKSIDRKTFFPESGKPMLIS